MGVDTRPAVGLLQKGGPAFGGHELAARRNREQRRAPAAGAQIDCHLSIGADLAWPVFVRASMCAAPSDRR